MLSKDQLATHKKFMTLSHLGARSAGARQAMARGRNLAHELGFRNEKIDRQWGFEDAGRLIQYMEIK